MSSQQVASKLSGAHILITGGAGFIGSNLAHELVDAGSRVTIIDSLIPEYGGNMENLAGITDQVALNISDIRDPHSIRALVQGVDVVFNLAGQTSHLDSMNDPQTDLDINAGAQLSLLEACRTENPKAVIVFASTRQFYGKPDYLPVDEDHPIRPVDVNGVNKWAGETYHLLYHQVYGMPTTALRLTNTYGPRMRVRDARQTFLGVWIKQVLTGEPIQIFGDGQQRRDFTYVDDCVKALLLAATRPEAVGRVFNLGSSEVINLKELAKMMTDLVPGSSYQLIPFPEDRKRIDIGDYFADTTLISQSLGWSPSIDLADGLARTVDYYREHGPAYWGEV